jgi:hypothetical protein
MNLAGKARTVFVTTGVTFLVVSLLGFLFTSALFCIQIGYTRISLFGGLPRWVAQVFFSTALSTLLFSLVVSPLALFLQAPRYGQVLMLLASGILVVFMYCVFEGKGPGVMQIGEPNDLSGLYCAIPTGLGGGGAAFLAVRWIFKMNQSTTTARTVPLTRVGSTSG